MLYTHIQPLTNLGLPCMRDRGFKTHLHDNIATKNVKVFLCISKSALCSECM